MLKFWGRRDLFLLCLQCKHTLAMLWMRWVHLYNFPGSFIFLLSPKSYLSFLSFLNHSSIIPVLWIETSSNLIFPYAILSTFPMKIINFSLHVFLQSTSQDMLWYALALKSLSSLLRQEVALKKSSGSGKEIWQ